MPLYDDRDQDYLKFLEEERISLTGQDCIFYSLIRGANVDPLYGEPIPNTETGGIGFVYREIFTVIGAIIFEQKDNRDPSVRSEGLVVDYDATMHIAINEWNKKKPSDFEPKEGDVVTGMGYYFDIIKSGGGGNIVDTNNYVGYELMLKRREKFKVERKV